jgi:hypothetical protein
MGAQALQAPVLVEAEPGVEGVGVARAEQAGACDGVGGEAVGHLEQSGTAFADIGAGVVVAVVSQQRALLLAQGERTADGHGIFLLCCSVTPIIRPLPILIVKVH